MGREAAENLVKSFSDTYIFTFILRVASEYIFLIGIKQFFVFLWSWQMVIIYKDNGREWY